MIIKQVENLKKKVEEFKTTVNEFEQKVYNFQKTADKNEHVGNQDINRRISTVNTTAINTLQAADTFNINVDNLKEAAIPDINARGKTTRKIKPKRKQKTQQKQKQKTQQKQKRL